MPKHDKYDRDAVWAEIWGPGGLELAESMADGMDLPAGSVVLDGGAGSGEISCFLSAEYGWSVLACEPSAERVNAIQRKANERGLSGVVAVRTDLTALDLADESVDGVFCQGVFEMLTDRRPRALQEMKRVVRRGGTIAIGEPMLVEEMSDDEAVRLYGENDDLDFRKCFRTLEWNMELARQNGLEVVTAYHHPDSRRLWDEYYAPLLDTDGTVKETALGRQAEIEVWNKDGGRYHSIGVMVLRRSE